SARVSSANCCPVRKSARREPAPTTKCAPIQSCWSSPARNSPRPPRKVERTPSALYNCATEAQGARWSSQASKLPFEPFAGLEGGFDSHTLPPTLRFHHAGSLQSVKAKTEPGRNGTARPRMVSSECSGGARLHSVGL